MSSRFEALKGRRAVLVTAGIAAVLVVGAGTSYAFWTGTGTGTGTAETGEGNTIHSTAEFEVMGLLYPSTMAVGDLGLRITSPVNANLTSITQNTAPGKEVTVADADTDGPACTGNFVELDPATVNIDLVGGVALSEVIEDVVRMAIDAPASCQGAKFTIPVILTGTESTP